MKTIFHGHSFIEINFDQGDKKKVILIDPFIEGNANCDVTEDELIEKGIDAIILTHGHDDHVWSTVTLAKKTEAIVICTYELGEYLIDEEGLPREKVKTQGIWWSADYDEYKVKFFQARHWWAIWNISSTYTTVAAWVILTANEKTIYHAGDTWLFWDMKMLGELYSIDVAFLPIGDVYTMWVNDAVIAASWIRANYVVPIHYNTRDIIKADDIEFARQVMLWNHWVPKVLRPGQSLILR